MSDYDMNKRMVESLLKSGAMDRLGKYRSQLIASYETIIDGAMSKKGSNIAGQLDFFSMAQGLDSSLEFKYPDLTEIPLSIKLAQEKEATGLYFSGHPLDSYRENIDDIDYTSIVSLNAEMASEKKMINLVGVINTLTQKLTRNGDKMAFFELGDRYGEIECIAFSRTYSQIYYKLKDEAAVVVSGTLQARDDEVKFIVNSLELLEKNGEYTPKKQSAKAEVKEVRVEAQRFGNATKVEKMYLRVPSLESKEFAYAKNIVEIFEGTTAVVFYDNSTKQYKASGLGFDVSSYTMGELKKLLGEENVVLK